MKEKRGLVKGGEGGKKPSWLMVPTLGASLPKLFSSKDDSKQSGGVQRGGERCQAQQL